MIVDRGLATGASPSSVDIATGRQRDSAGRKEGKLTPWLLSGLGPGFSQAGSLAEELGSGSSNTMSRIIPTTCSKIAHSSVMAFLAPARPAFERALVDVPRSELRHPPRRHRDTLRTQHLDPTGAPFQRTT